MKYHIDVRSNFVYAAIVIDVEFVEVRLFGDVSEVTATKIVAAHHIVALSQHDVCQVTFYDGKAISVELPNTIVREVEYTEPAVRGDTTGKIMKPARLAGTGFEIPVAAFVEIGDRIEIDPHNNEFRKRV